MANLAMSLSAAGAGLLAGLVTQAGGRLVSVFAYESVADSDIRGNWTWSTGPRSGPVDNFAPYGFVQCYIAPGLTFTGGAGVNNAFVADCGTACGLLGGQLT